MRMVPRSLSSTAAALVSRARVRALSAQRISPRAGTHRAIRLPSSPPSGAASATAALSRLIGASPEHHRAHSPLGASNTTPRRLFLCHPVGSSSYACDMRSLCAPSLARPNPAFNTDALRPAASARGLTPKR
jgi:hypothetical protein